MKTRKLLIFLSVVLLSSCGGGGGGADMPGLSEETAGAPVQGASNALLRTCGLEGGPLRVMPLGDSVTESERGHSSYRYLLWKALQAVPCNVDFVGSRRGVSTGNRDSAQVSPAQPDFDQDHEGHWDYSADEVLNSIDFWAAAAQPDVVLLHLGTNDTRQREGSISVVADIGSIIDRLRLVNPRVAVIVAQIIPSRTDSFRLLNDAIPGLAAEKDTAESRVIVANHAANFSPSGDLYDRVHPGPSGEAKMADTWLNAILELAASS